MRHRATRSGSGRRAAAICTLFSLAGVVLGLDVIWAAVGYERTDLLIAGALLLLVSLYFSIVALVVLLCCCRDAKRQLRNAEKRPTAVMVGNPHPG